MSYQLAMQDPPRATTRSAMFRLETEIQVDIRAKPERIWQLLTDASDFPRWNSTVTSIEGSIALGGKLELRVPISERTFTPKVSDLKVNERMVWSDGAAPFFRGVRTFELEPRGEQTLFRMREVMTGVLLPMIRGSLPDFAPVFEQYARDLKQEAEGAG
ncbi:MAG: SRPBCC domain-containing protein [Myxococcales bacterium]|nr:SRPBCC domain-containing protein [Myxococcales bacterium]